MTSEIFLKEALVFCFKSQTCSSHSAMCHDKSPDIHTHVPPPPPPLFGVCPSLISLQLSSFPLGVFPSGQHPYRVPSHPPRTGGCLTHASMQDSTSGNSKSTEVSLSTHGRRVQCPLEELKYKRVLVPRSRGAPVPLHDASFGSQAHLGSLEAERLGKERMYGRAVTPHATY